MEKTIDDMSVIELKAKLFDIEQDIRYLNIQYKDMISILQSKIDSEEQKEEDK